MSRHRLSRVKGARLPPATLAVCRPTRWGNPFKVVPGLRTAEEAVALYERALLAGELAVTVDEVRRQLSGFDLACWCPLGSPCHADVLLRVAAGVEE